MVGDRSKALKVGFAGYIEKPINPDTFAQEVSRFLKDHQAGRETNRA
jgi:CheY-like chemotaxis protein